VMLKLGLLTPDRSHSANIGPLGLSVKWNTEHSLPRKEVQVGPWHSFRRDRECPSACCSLSVDVRMPYRENLEDSRL